MKRIILLSCLAASLLLPAALLADYPYYGTDDLASYNNSFPNWNINGTGSNSGSAGLTVTSAAGASYIAKSPSADGAFQYEVKATVKLAASGGNYVLYLEATPNALLGSTSIGSFYAVAVQNPTFANGGCPRLPPSTKPLAARSRKSAPPPCPAPTKRFTTPLWETTTRSISTPITSST